MRAQTAGRQGEIMRNGIFVATVVGGLAALGSASASQQASNSHSHVTSE